MRGRVVDDEDRTRLSRKARLDLLDEHAPVALLVARRELDGLIGGDAGMPFERGTDGDPLEGLVDIDVAPVDLDPVSAREGGGDVTDDPLGVSDNLVNLGECPVPLK